MPWKCWVIMTPMFGCWSSLFVFLPFCFWALCQLWMLVLSLYSLLFVSRHCLGYWMLILSLCSLLFVSRRCLVLAFDVGPLFVFPPFVFWVLFRLWMLVLSSCSLDVLVLSLCSLLLFLDNVLASGCWSSLCAPPSFFFRLVLFLN